MKNYRKEILSQIKAAGIKLPKNADLDGGLIFEDEITNK